MLGELVLAAADELREVFTRAVAAEGLTFVEGRALRLAVIHGRQSVMVDILGVAPSRVSTLLRTLEREGLVVRSTSLGDRRQRDLTVTAAGYAALARIIDRLDARSPLMTSLTHDERVTLHDLLGRVVARDPPPGPTG